MNAFFNYAETMVKESRLSEIAKSMKNKPMDFETLDRPIAMDLKYPLESESFRKLESRELTDLEKKQIKDETGWSDGLIDSFSSMKEYGIYKDAGLRESEVNGFKCLIRDDIDWDQKDEFGQSNSERTSNKLSPINTSGETVELHHVGQNASGPFAELTESEHRRKGNDSILHDVSRQGLTSSERYEFNNYIKPSYWQTRANET